MRTSFQDTQADLVILLRELFSLEYSAQKAVVTKEGSKRASLEASRDLQLGFTIPAPLPPLCPWQVAELVGTVCP